MAEWIDDVEGWKRTKKSDGARGLVCPHSGTSWHWQAVRGDERLSGVEADEAAAKAVAEHALSLPTDEFNALVVQYLSRQIDDLVARIIAISPTAKVLPGWNAGWNDCLASVHDAIGGLQQ